MHRDWNQAYLDGSTPWDKGVAAPPLLEFLGMHAVTGRILVPGCGTGHDVRALSAVGAEVQGVDIAEEAIRRAKAIPVVGRETYTKADFFKLPDRSQASYDWVFEHTCLCAIDPSQRSTYRDTICHLLKPRGQFLAIFFREVVDYDGDGPPHPIGADEISALFESDFEVLNRFTPKQHYPERPYGCEEVVHFVKRI